MRRIATACAARAARCVALPQPQPQPTWARQLCAAPQGSPDALLPPPSSRGRSAAAAEQAAAAFAGHLQRSPRATADALAASLSEKQREALMAALLERTAASAASPEAATAELFAKADTDEDGVISRDEFARAASSSAPFRAVMQANAAAVEPPSWRALGRVAAVSAVPFIGFGFCDNSIMILSGDVIEASVGVALGLSTMAAAGCGNMVSDVLGIGISGQIERTCDAMGFRSRLTAAQMQLRSTQMVVTFSRCLGVGFGCVLGMFPLLLGTHDAALAAEAASALHAVADSVR